MVSKTFNIYISYDRKLSGTIIMGHPNPGLKRPQHTQMGFGTRAGPLPKLGRPKAFSGTEGPKHHRPTAHYHGTALSRPRWLWSLLRLARGPSAGCSRSAGSLRLARGPLYRAPPQGLGAGGSPPRSRPPSAGGDCGPTTRRDGAHLLVNHSTA